MRFIWDNAETEEVWEKVQKEQYDYVIAHYLLEFISDINVFIYRVANVLKTDGLFSVNGFYVSTEHYYWKKMFEEMGLKTGFIDAKIKAEESQTEQFRELLQKYFSNVETVILDNSMRYENIEEILENLYQRYPENRKYMEENEAVMEGFFGEMLDKEESVIVQNASTFWHCVK